MTPQGQTPADPQRCRAAGPGDGTLTGSWDSLDPARSQVRGHGWRAGTPGGFFRFARASSRPEVAGNGHGHRSRAGHRRPHHRWPGRIPTTSVPRTRSAVILSSFDISPGHEGAYTV